ncbi:cysteinyl-tRNA synthetase [Sphingomonas sp. UYAg733]
MTGTPLTLYNSLTRSLEGFEAIDPSLVRVYTCGPTVYNYQHIGNMRAFLFADTLGRVLRWKGWPTKHIINITDVGHLTSDADVGDDKMEKAAVAQAKSIWEIAAHYTGAFKHDVARLNIVPPAEWTVATDHIAQMIDFAEKIAPEHCYEIDSGLYFDSTSVSDYGRLARSVSDVDKDGGESRIDPVSGKRHPQDFAIWRKSPEGEQRQMEWDSPWGKGAPGWHLECSVMSHQHLGHPFDIHTGGIDHREIHHPNEIAQNQAFCSCGDSGARIWMHNNFLVAKDPQGRGGKMSKSTGEFLKLQVLVDAGYHPLVYRLLCLQAHYRSELEFTWDNLAAAATRLKRLVQAIEKLRSDAPGNADKAAAYLARLEEAVSDDLATPRALPVLEEMIADKRITASDRLAALTGFDAVLGLELATVTRADLRVRPATATVTAEDIDARLADRKQARADKDFARSDAIRDELASAGVDVMDGDPLGWDWRLN